MSENKDDQDAPRPADERTNERREFLQRLGALGLANFAFSLLGGTARAQSDAELECGDPLPDGTVVFDLGCGKTGPAGVERDWSCGQPAGTTPTWVYNDLDCNGAYVTEGKTHFHSDDDCAEPGALGGLYSDESCQQLDPARPGAAIGDDDCGKVLTEGSIHGDGDCGYLKSPVGRHTDEDCGVALGGPDDRCNATTDFGGLYEDGDCAKATSSGGTHTDNNCSSGPLGNYVDSDCAVTGSDSNPPNADG